MIQRRIALIVWLLAGAVPSVCAQSAPPIGVRAAGMGGAFTAVADDGTAPFWNPAGLASGAFVGLVADFNSLDRQSGLFLGLATPPLGLTYYRTTSTAKGSSDRNGLVVQHAGVTVVQSLGDHGLAAGATLKYVHGNAASAFDADAGVMLSGSLGQIGVTVHNLFAPSLGDVQLDRRVRAGVAVHVRQDLTAAGDVEFTTSAAPSGEWRDVALGLESHPVRTAWLRGGVHWNSAAGPAAPIGSVGGSYAIYGSLRADAQVSFGSKEGDRGWGIGLTFLY
jgi:hypothetical protein